MKYFNFILPYIFFQTLKKNESTVSDKELDIKTREETVSESLIQIEQRQKIIERKENMIREMSQLLLNQEMTSTRELNFHTRRFNRHHDDPRRNARFFRFLIFYRN